MSYLDEYGDPSEDLINDWNIHNDHQEGNEDEDALWCSWHECHPDRCREVRH